MRDAAAAHLLIVDDDARIRDLLSRFLRRNGHLVTLARDAAQARRLLAGLDFDLVVLDVMMPGEDGIALTRDLRRRSATPVLLLTAKGETGDRIAGLEAGADDYLAKPFDPRELLLRIAAILRIVETTPGLTQVAALADQAGLGVRSLQQLFSEYVGVSPKWVIRRFRLHEAADRLAHGTDVDLGALAQDLGYVDQAHFTSDFRRLVGVAPGRYREQVQVEQTGT